LEGGSRRRGKGRAIEARVAYVLESGDGWGNQQVTVMGTLVLVVVSTN